ncbi:MAG: inositol monophosphatase family protein [Pseudomonadota bacterium]
MATLDLERRYLAACAMAREAGDLARRLFESRDGSSFELKGPQDYMTEADTAVERLIVERIAAAFPADACFGEEGGGRLGPEVWVIDPIDGTANFARGIPHFCVSIAFMRDGRTALGAIMNPMTGELFAARRGEGATLNGRAMRVSAISDPRQATVELGWSLRRPIADYVALVDRVMATGAGFRRAGSGTLGLVYVADGRAEGYCELHINSWDALAALLMVEEAGGWTNDFLANDGLARGNPVLASAPGLKDALIAATGIGP